MAEFFSATIHRLIRPSTTKGNLVVLLILFLWFGSTFNQTLKNLSPPQSNIDRLKAPSSSSNHARLWSSHRLIRLHWWPCFHPGCTAIEPHPCVLAAAWQTNVFVDSRYTVSCYLQLQRCNSMSQWGNSIPCNPGPTDRQMLPCHRWLDSTPEATRICSSNSTPELCEVIKYS